MAKKKMRWLVLVAGIAAIAFVGYRYWQSMQNAVPKGIAYGNGRVEAKLVDIVAKEGLRVKEILADEGDLVMPGQVLVRLDTATSVPENSSKKMPVQNRTMTGALRHSK
jgi:HlyD family secretion protein